MFGGLAVAKNLLCVAHADVRGRVFSFDLEAQRLVATWEYGPVDGGYADAGGVAMAPDFSLFVADTRNDVVRCFNAFGVEVGRLGLPVAAAAGAAARDRNGTLDRPRAVVVADGIVFVACGERPLRRGVQRLRRRGAVLQPLRALGSAEQRFGAPRGLWAGARELLVADTLHGVVQRFTLAGRYVGRFSTALAADETSRPIAVVELADGDTLVADAGDRPGLRRCHAGGGVEVVCENDDFIEPVGLARDARGRVYVLDRDGERVRRLSAALTVERDVVDLAGELRGG